MARPDPILIQVPERIKGERIILAAPVAGLGPILAATVAASLEHLKPWMPWAQEAPSMEDSEAVMRRMQADFIARRDLCFQIYSKAADGSCAEMLGGTGLHRIDWELRKFEIGYWIRPSSAGRGYVSEAVRLLTELAFGQLRARRVEIRMDERNLASRAVAEACGFEFEGLLRSDALGVDGEPRDTQVYARISG
ncbi:RimJ/RimL family protein N-acetyltransferase [Paucibacter oligotrophus]|uniref:RimJ/RimL family protein N-acetyltransferase n=1 Tax=Roseateles oligotrophus TaxID=1769250 RepID=A0A840LD59_9BURK|nr:GNAT family protein [Roseateles oligotrophus]MBB4846100.1 RimJ/RimL family protein N-acetyltransferase [Roseateles oligotrophus]